MRLIITSLLCFVFLSKGFAQLNAELVSVLPYEQAVNDVWGWVAEDSTEYAIVGTQVGVSVVSLADPTAPEEVAFADGLNSSWRDMKTWGNFCYAINETGDGLLVMDLSNLPDTMTYTYWSPFISGLGGQLSTCHNIYIDEFGVAYLAGCNLNSGGIIFIDVATMPGQPQYIGRAANVYAHDVYTLNNTMYTSDIYTGNLTVHDVTNKLTPQVLANQGTPFFFTHNAWTTADQTVVFTTDERANAPVAAYDISDLDNILELDQFRPLKTIGTGVIPHNVHVLDNYVVTSYYTDGVVIIDANRPTNLVEVSSWDTEKEATGGFQGAWGAYPFLPSGLVLGSDRSNGLFVTRHEYKRACYFEGLVVDEETQEPLNDVRIRIMSEAEALEDRTNLEGTFATGTVINGAYNVFFTKPGYFPKRLSINLENGEVVERRVELEPLMTFTIGGQVIDRGDGDPIANAVVNVVGEEVSFSMRTDDTGNFAIDGVYEGTYEIIVGAWGFQSRSIGQLEVDSQEEVTIDLAQGYEDDFSLDLGWQVSGNALTGQWERGEPIGTNFGFGNSNPEFDIDTDNGNQCYVTGNAGGGAGTDDVDDGNTILTSPIMDLTIYENPELKYNLWFFNAGGDDNPNDTLRVTLSNGETEVVLEEVRQSNPTWRSPSIFVVEDYLEVTDQMQIRFETGDQLSPFGHILEAGVDGFIVSEAFETSTTATSAAVHVEVFPNPFVSNITLEIDANEFASKQWEARLLDASGKTVQVFVVNSPVAALTVDASLPNGNYYLEVYQDQLLYTSKTIAKLADN